MENFIIKILSNVLYVDRVRIVFKDYTTLEIKQNLICSTLDKSIYYVPTDKGKIEFTLNDIKEIQCFVNGDNKNGNLQ